MLRKDDATSLASNETKIQPRVVISKREPHLTAKELKTILDEYRNARRLIKGIDIFLPSSSEMLLVNNFYLQLKDKEKELSLSDLFVLCRMMARAYVDPGSETDKAFKLISKKAHINLGYFAICAASPITLKDFALIYKNPRYMRYLCIALDKLYRHFSLSAVVILINDRLHAHPQHAENIIEGSLSVWKHRKLFAFDLKLILQFPQQAKALGASCAEVCKMNFSPELKTALQKTMLDNPRYAQQIIDGFILLCLSGLSRNPQQALLFCQKYPQHISGIAKGYERFSRAHLDYYLSQEHLTVYVDKHYEYFQDLGNYFYTIMKYIEKVKTPDPSLIKQNHREFYEYVAVAEDKSILSELRELKLALDKLNEAKLLMHLAAEQVTDKMLANIKQASDIADVFLATSPVSTVMNMIELAMSSKTNAAHYSSSFKIFSPNRRFLMKRNLSCRI